MPRLAVLFLILLLSACGPRLVQTDVTRFHQLPAVAAGKTFTILPEQGQRGSLEFQRYAEIVAGQLVQTGWRPVPATADADAVVFLHWGVGQPRSVTWSSPSSVYTGMGWGPRSHWYGAGVGFPLGDPFPYWETRSATYFPKWVDVDILDADAYAAGERKVLFEGRTVTESGGREITPVVPYLIRALFTGFPGASGQTVRVSIPIEGQ